MNQYLASKGYTVLSVNYRLGIMYGRKFREPAKSVWRGASEYQDVIAGAKFLQTLDNVDPQRIGLWGGSYGGFLTAMGLARNSDIFKAGVDFHGVHDWAIFLPMWAGGRRRTPLRPTSKKRASSRSNHRQSQASRTGAPRSVCPWRRRSQRAVPANHRSGRKTARPKSRVRRANLSPTKFTTCSAGAIGSAPTAPPPNSSTATWLPRASSNNCPRRAGPGELRLPNKLACRIIG